MPARINPSNGNKPDKLMRDAIIVALHRKANDANGRPTKRLYLVADKLVQQAIAGDMAAIKEVNDRVDGKAVQPIAGSVGVDVNLHAWLVAAAAEALRLEKDDDVIEGQAVKRIGGE